MQFTLTPPDTIKQPPLVAVEDDVLVIVKTPAIFAFDATAIPPLVNTNAPVEVLVLKSIPCILTPTPTFIFSATAKPP